MSGKELYNKTFDEVNISDYTKTKLMLMYGKDFSVVQSEHIVYRIVKAAIVFLGLLFANGTLFSVYAIQQKGKSKELLHKGA